MSFTILLQVKYDLKHIVYKIIEKHIVIYENC